MKKCPLCPKQYQSSKDLDKHLKKYHNTTIENINQSKRKPIVTIKCESCGREF